VSELGDILELLYGAPRRFTTVRGVIREWEDHRLSEIAARVEGAGNEMPVSGSTRDSSVSELTVRVWVDQEWRFREEWDPGPGSKRRIEVRNRDRRWTFEQCRGIVEKRGAPAGIAQTHYASHLLAPCEVICELELIPAGFVEFLGRKSRRVSCQPCRGYRGGGLARLGEGADEYRLLVDAEIGVVLRTEASFAGQPFLIIEFTEIEFDRPLRDRLFEEAERDPS